MKAIRRGHINQSECIVTEDCIYLGHYLSGEKIYPEDVDNWEKTKSEYIEMINNG